MAFPYNLLARLYFLVATILLMAMAGVLLVLSMVEVIIAFDTTDRINAVLDSVGLLIIGFAIIETAKFVAEEEIIRRRELRSAMESRRSLTKFITIIVIASSLEALVMIFKTSRTSLSDTIYPSALFGVSMFALVALGTYQWLSSRIEPPTAQERQEARRAQEREDHSDDDPTSSED